MAGVYGPPRGGTDRPARPSWPACPALYLYSFNKGFWPPGPSGARKRPQATSRGPLGPVEGAEDGLMASLVSLSQFVSGFSSLVSLGQFGLVWSISARMTGNARSICHVCGRCEDGLPERAGDPVLVNKGTLIGSVGQSERLLRGQGLRAVGRCSWSHGPCPIIPVRVSLPPSIPCPLRYTSPPSLPRLLACSRTAEFSKFSKFTEFGYWLYPSWARTPRRETRLRTSSPHSESRTGQFSQSGPV